MFLWPYNLDKKPPKTTAVYEAKPGGIENILAELGNKV